MNVFKEIAALLGWLSGSLAGIAGIFYACGYLIMRAHLNLLGVGALLSVNKEQYMQEGAKFMAEMANLVAQTALPLLMTSVVVAAVVILLWQAVIKRHVEAAKAKVAKHAAQWPLARRSLLYGVLLILLAGAIDHELVHFTYPLEVSDLLFPSSPTMEGQPRKVMELLLAGDRETLDSFYSGLTLSVLKVGILLLLAWRVVEPWRLRMLFAAPFALTLLLAMLMLPMAYGVLKKPVRFPLITVVSDNKMLASVTGQLYLLDRIGDQVILYDQAGRRVLWLPRDEVNSAVIGRTSSLFGGQGSGRSK